MKLLSIYLLSGLFIIAGIAHWVMPAPFVEIVPTYLGHPLFLVKLSGLFEILGGLGLLVPRVRKWAGYGLLALIVAVFPANIFMATHHPFISGHAIPHWLLWLRLPLQFVLLGWVWLAAVKRE